MTNTFIDVSLHGVVPLLQHRFIMDAKGGKPKPNIKDKDIAKESLYLDDKGVICQPGEHIEKSMTKAAVQFKFKGKKTYKDFVQSGVFVVPALVPHKIQKWEVDKRPVVIIRSRIPRVRPIFNSWQLDFQLEVINPDLDYKILNEILVYAGNFVGIGDYRPKFGRFVVSKFEELK